MRIYLTDHAIIRMRQRFCTDKNLTLSALVSRFEKRIDPALFSKARRNTEFYVNFEKTVWVCVKTNSKKISVLTIWPLPSLPDYTKPEKGIWHEIKNLFKRQGNE